MKRLGKPAFGRLGIQDLPYGFGSRRLRNYTRKILTPNPGVGYDPSRLILSQPMNELAGGVAYDHSPEGNDGAYTGVTLGQPGIGDGLTCPLFGVGDLNNIYSAAFNGDFDGAELTIAGFFKVRALSVWTSGVWHFLFAMDVDGDNRIRYYIDGITGDRLTGVREGNNVPEWWALAGINSVDFVHFGVTVGEIADEVRVYIDGIQSGVTAGTLGAWAGNLDPNLCVIGAQTSLPTNPFDGYLAHWNVWTAPVSPTSMAYLGTP